tara:strand:- start:60360 stop:60860 length:501 start_codon:yes stop_codon:yes gene_type:complete
MKRLIPLLLILLLTASYYPSYKASGRNHIAVSEHLQPYYNEFVEIADKNNLEIDWSRIKSVDLVPLAHNIQGYWSRASETVMISYYYTFPMLVTLTKEEKDDLILMTLAHEIGHSQGWKHTNPDHMGLMNPSARFDMTALRGMGAEAYIVICFKAEAAKANKKPLD